jgi:flagellar basal-body rod modification protein FlgD
MTSPIDMVGSTGVVPTSATSNAAKAAAAGPAELDKNQFLELMLAQMKNQNPLAPQGTQEFLSQMAAFSTLEQITNLSAGQEEMNELEATNQSLSLVGHKVAYLKKDGTTGEGTVESVDFETGGFSLTIGGEKGLLPGAVTEVS